MISSPSGGGMAAALNVAEYLLHLSASEDEPDPLSHLRLQKLVYYVQGWSLAKRNAPMFPDKIEAWAHGPVVAKLFLTFAAYESDTIPSERFPYSGGLKKDDREWIEAVWNVYKKYSATSLREMTHRETPWKQARGKAKSAERCSTEITQTSMKRFFIDLAK